MGNFCTGTLPPFSEEAGPAKIPRLGGGGDVEEPDAGPPATPSAPGESFRGPFAQAGPGHVQEYLGTSVALDAKALSRPLRVKFSDATGQVYQVVFTTHDYGMALGLDTAGSARSYATTGKPLVVVKAVDQGGQADRLGVRTGWAIRLIGDAEVTGADQAFALLKRENKNLPTAELPLSSARGVDGAVSGKAEPVAFPATATGKCFRAEFADIRGALREVEFRESDLGLRLALGGQGRYFGLGVPKGKAGVIVRMVEKGGHADSLGVEVDWHLLSIEGSPVLSLQAAQERLDERAAWLGRP